MTPEEKMAAMIAVEILERAEDSAKLFIVHRHWPEKGQAVSYGFYAMLGAIFAVCAALGIGRVTMAAINAVWP